MENLKGSLIRSSDKSNTTGVFSIKIDQQNKEMLKMVFIKLLNQLSAAVQNEQTFCQEFFNLKGPKSEDSNSLNSSNNQQLLSQNDTSNNSTILSQVVSTKESKQDL